MITIEILGNPIPLQRPRLGKNAIYNSQSKIMEMMKWQIKSQFKQEPFNCPIAVGFIFYFPIPKSSSKVRKREMLNGYLKHLNKPDLSNLVKFYEDIGNGILWNDDSQIYRYLHTEKKYSDQPAVVLNIEVPRCAVLNS